MLLARTPPPPHDCPERTQQKRGNDHGCRLPKTFLPTSGVPRPESAEVRKNEKEENPRLSARRASRGTSRPPGKHEQHTAGECAWDCAGERFLRKEKTVTGSSTREAPLPSAGVREAQGEFRRALLGRKTSAEFVGINQKTCAAASLPVGGKECGGGGRCREIMSLIIISAADASLNWGVGITDVP